jgi:hypothetical protein
VEGVNVVRVQFRRFSEPDPSPTWVDSETRAVPAEPFANVDEGQGGITFGDISDETMIAPLAAYAAGAEVYVESEDMTECLDDDTSDAERSSHIWWRAKILGPS